MRTDPVSYNDTTMNTLNAQRAALRTALFNFATSTLPPAVATAVAAVIALDPAHPVLDGLNPEDVEFYQSCVVYVNRLIAAKRYAGAALRWP